MLGDLELFYARPSVSAPGLFQALSGTVSSVRASSWQLAQQLDCLLELEGALQVSRAQELGHVLSGWWLSCHCKGSCLTCRCSHHLPAPSALSGK